VGTSFVTQPNMYARGILFGKMKYELGDHAMVKSPELGLEADIEFKVKGWVGGGYNAIAGYIKESHTGKNLYEFSGHWNEKMYIKDLTTGKKELIFDATHAKPSIPKSRPLEEQAPRESQRLWHATTEAIKKADQKVATEEKSKIEDEQRREAAERGDRPWHPKLFRPAPEGDEENLDWVIDAEVDHTAPAEKQIEQILAIAPIVPGQKPKEQFYRDEQLPSQPGKSLPKSSPHSTAAATGGDLIDFGQNDLAQHSDTHTASPASASRNGTSLQQPLVPTQSSPARGAEPGKPAYNGGDPIRRMDSSGAEDVFHDAES
jgi:hypothetical protein